MEPISFSASIVTLAGLFSTCVECFGYFQAAQSFAKGYGLLLVKLDVEKTRLLAWGDAVGVLDPSDLHLVPPFEHIQVVEDCLEKIKDLLEDANNLRNKYGLREGTLVAAGQEKSKESFSICSRFWLKYKTRQSRPGTLARTIWAIYDKTKFETLIDDLRGFVNSLNDILPREKTTAQDRKIRLDLESIPDITNLRIIETACAGVYENWSEAASVVIETSGASVLGSRRARSIEEWMGGRHVESHDDTDIEERRTLPVVNPGIAVNTADDTVFLIFTDPCLDISNSHEGYCNAGYYSHLASETHRWNIGRRISDDLDYKNLTVYDESDLFSVQNYENDHVRKVARIVGRVHIYCAPCRCLVRTAKGICKGPGISAHLEFGVRVDRCLKATCCSTSPSTIKNLQSFLNESEEQERAGYHDDDYIDRPWIEKSIYATEQEKDQTLNDINPSPSGRTLIEQHFLRNRSDPMVVIGELDSCVELMKEFDCVTEPRMPREGEIWKIHPLWDREPRRRRWKRERFGTYAPSWRALKGRRERAIALKTPDVANGDDLKASISTAGRVDDLSYPSPHSSSKRKRSTSSVGTDRDLLSTRGEDQVS